MNKKVLLLGSNGQLGTDIKRYFKQLSGINLITAGRQKTDDLYLDALNFNKHTKSQILATKPDYIINCIVLKKDLDPNLYKVNSDFPNALARICDKKQIKLIHISTDAVFCDTTPGGHSPADKPNPSPGYPLSKYQGENKKMYLIIRTTFIGGKISLYQKTKNLLKINPLPVGWNGVTTLCIAQILHNIIKHKYIFKTNIMHLCTQTQLDTRLKQHIEINRLARTIGPLKKQQEDYKAWQARAK